MTVTIKTHVKDDVVHLTVKSPTRSRSVPMPQYTPDLNGMLACSEFANDMRQGINTLGGHRHA